MSRATHSYLWVQDVCRPLVKTLNITFMYFLCLYSAIPRMIFASEHVLDLDLVTDLTLRTLGIKTVQLSGPKV